MLSDELRATCKALHVLHPEAWKYADVLRDEIERLQKRVEDLEKLAQALDNWENGDPFEKDINA